MSMTNEPNLMDKEIENQMEVTILNYRILKISFNNNVLFWKKKGGKFYLVKEERWQKRKMLYQSSNWLIRLTL